MVGGEKMTLFLDLTLDIAALLTLIMILVVVFFNSIQYWQMRKQLKNNFFAEYTKRYQEIALHFPLDIYEDTFSYDSLDEKTRDEVPRYIKIYFDLCYEEWFLNKNKKIDKKVWDDWKEGICFAFSKRAFKEAWDKFYADSDFYKDFKKYVDSELIKNKKESR